MMNGSIVLMLAVALLLDVSSCEAFVNHPAQLTSTRSNVQETSSELGLGDFFDGFREFWEDLSGGSDKKKSELSNPFPSFGADTNADVFNADVDDEDMPAGTTRIATIPVKSIKQGGLRLFIMFYCLGMQNTPDKNSWKANQPTTEEYVVEMIFHDKTAQLTVELLEHEVRIERFGSLPSTQYLMHESMIVQGILDELEQCAFPTEEIDEENRLICPEPKDAIDIARGAISFG